MFIGRRQRILLPLIMSIIALGLIACGAQPGAGVSPGWSRIAPPQNVAQSGPLVGKANPTGDRAQIADLITLEVQDNLYAEQGSAFHASLVGAFRDGMDRFGTEPTRQISVTVIRAPDCLLRGITYPEHRTVQVYTCATIQSDRAITILAHEFIHQLAYERYGSQDHVDQILTEGVATWAAQSSWLHGQPDPRAYVCQQRADGLFFPLATDATGQGEDIRNAVNYEWASFVDYLIDTYGRPALDQVYITGAATPGSADYAAAYQKDFATLEREWRAWLDS